MTQPLLDNQIRSSAHLRRRLVAAIRGCSAVCMFQPSRASTRYGKSMTVEKVTVSLDPAVAERARRDVAEGKAKSLSAWLNDAGRARVEGEDLAEVLAEFFDETGGPLTEQELARARHRLALAEQH
jgi:hypothetical protein